MSEMRIWLADDIDTTDAVEGFAFVGVIEWGSDSGEDPAVTIARTVEEVERWYRDVVTDALQECDPVPPAADASHDVVRRWMEEWREAKTEAWLTVYRRQLP